MSAGNSVNLIGNLTRDPQTKHIAEGKSVTNFGLALNKKRGGKEYPVFIECTAWNKTGELISQYVSKGQPLSISGELSMDFWEKDGQKHSKLYVTVTDMKFLGGRDQSNNSQAHTPPAASTPPVASGPSFGDDEPPFAPYPSEVM